jgi:hypothetical protein
MPARWEGINPPEADKPLPYIMPGRNLIAPLEKTSPAAIAHRIAARLLSASDAGCGVFPEMPVEDPAAFWRGWEAVVISGRYGMGDPLARSSPRGMKRHSK